MARRRDERPQWVVEVEVEAVAVVTVRAESADAACDAAERTVRPVDVHELGEVTGLRCVRVGDELRRVMRTRARRGRATVSTGPLVDGQS